MKRTLFFLFLAMSCVTAGAQQAQIVVVESPNAPVISRHIYGQFAEHLGRSIYDGFYRNGKIRADIAQALKKIKIPNLRWPGGCFADQYHWRDGIGDRTKRPKRVNTTWGMVTENNSFGTHEFLELCKMIGCEPYFAGNVGTGTPQEMSDWIEYLNFNGDSELANLRRKNGQKKPYNVAFWGIGNESWGCGGTMTPSYYANLYKQYNAFCHDYPGSPLKKVVSGANADDYNWTEVCMRDIPGRLFWGYSLHYYTWLSGKYPPSGSATNFGEDEYFNAMQQSLRMEEIVSKHSAIMDKYDSQKKKALVVDEWGIWVAPEPGTNPAFLYQQNSLRDALIAATTLNIFNNHADRVKMANLAQTVNVIHSLILTKGEQMVLTPTYHVFDLMKVHQQSKLIPLKVSSPEYRSGAQSIQAVNASASIDSLGTKHFTLVNIDPSKAITVEIPIDGKSVAGQLLTAQKINSFNDFGKEAEVRLVAFSGAGIANGKITVSLPAKSIVQLAVK